MMGDPTPNTERPQLWTWVAVALAVSLVICLCLSLSAVAGFFAYRTFKDDQPTLGDLFQDSDETLQDSATAEPTEESDQDSEDGPTGEDVSIQYAGHIDPGEDHTPYNSDPPTSGQHYAVPAEAGFYTEAPEDEQLVHNLEHGYVIIWYNCDDLTSEECEQLQDDIQFAMEEAGNSPITGTPKLIAVPRPGMDALIALTTWGRLDKFDAFDAKRIVNFIRDFRDRAPEPNVP